MIDVEGQRVGTFDESIVCFPTPVRLRRSCGGSSVRNDRGEKGSGSNDVRAELFTVFLKGDIVSKVNNVSMCAREIY